MMGYRIRKPELIPTLFMLFAIGVMFSLGVWQLNRLAWKEDLIARVQAGRTAEPLTQIPAQDAAMEAMEFLPLEVKGTFLHDKELHMAGRYVRGVLGYLVLTPLEMADGRKLLVNRGFVPAHLKEPDSRPESLPPGQVRVVGLVRKDNNRNYFTPDNAPEKNIWFTREHKVMGEQIEETLLPITIDQLRGTGIGEYPEPVGGEITLRNDHLGYAITWFLIGITGIIMFLVYYAEPKKAEDA